MLRGSHGGHGHQVLQLRGIAVVTFHKTAQMLGSVVDELAASDVIMRWYWPLRRCVRDYCQIIPLQRNMRGLIVRQNHVSSMTLCANKRSEDAPPAKSGRRRPEQAWMLTFGS